MTKGTKIVLIIAAACIALSIVLFGIGARMGGTRFADGFETEIFGVGVHIGTDGFYAGPVTTIDIAGFEHEAEFTEKIDEIEIHWTSGEVNFEFGGENITVRESADGEIEDKNTMICTVKNGTLIVKYHADRVEFMDLSGMQTKNLTVTIPEHLAAEIKIINVDTTSADVTIGGFELDRLTIDSTSGCAFVTDLSAGIFVFGATSGDLTLENGSFGNFSAHTTSGAVSLADVSAGEAEFDVISGDITAENCSFGKVEAESTSGSFSMSLNSVPSEFEAGTTSGNVEIFLPEDAEFTLEFDPTSGDLELDFAAVMRGDEYIVGNGKNEISIETTSGDAYIKIK